VLDSTEQDFQNILNVTGRIFEIGVHRSDGCLSTILCPNSEFLETGSPKGKHSWLNASSAKDLTKRVRHVLSACSLNPLSNSVCVLTRQSMPIDMSLLKDFCCILTVPKGGLVRQLQRTAPSPLCKAPNVCRSCIVPQLQIVCLLKQGCLRVRFWQLLHLRMVRTGFRA
jgi:hypothetical protein